MPDQVVKTTFKGKDLISKTFKAMGKSVKDFAGTADKSFRNASRSAGKFKSITGGILTAGLVTKGMGLASRAIRGVTEEFISFDQSVTAAAAKFPEKIRRGTDEFKALQDVAREVGANTKFSATEAAGGLDFLAMAGFNASQAMAALPRLTDLATAGAMDLARASDIASDALGAFNLMTKDSAQLNENLGRINDVMAKTVTSANLDMEMYFETMKQAAPVATAAGASLEEFSTLMGEMANAGIKGSMAGTTLKNMFLNLQKPAKEAQTILKDWKVELVDTKTGALRPMIDIIGDMNKATSKMGKAQKGAAIETIFGKRAVAGVNVLLAAGTDKLKAYEKELINSKGAAAEMAAEIEKSLGNKLLALKSAAIEVGLKFFDAFGAELPGAIDKAIAAVRKFDVKPVIEGVKTAVEIISKLVGWVVRLKPVIIAAGTAWIFYKAQVKAAMALNVVSQFVGITRAAQVATGAKGIGGFARTAINGMGKGGAVTLAVGAVALAVYQIHKNSDALKAAWDTDFKDWWKGWDSVKGIAHEMVVEVKTLLGLQKELKSGIQKVPPGQEPVTKNIKTRTDPGFKRLGGRLEGTRPRERMAPGRQAPNKAQTEAQMAAVTMNQKIDVNAPAGTTVKSETKTKGSPRIKTELAGANI